MKFDIGILKMADALATHSAVRQSVIAENIANSDTPGFKAKDIAAFSDVFGAETAQAISTHVTRQGHVHFDDATGGFALHESARKGSESPNGNTVGVEDQMVRAAEVRHQHDLALGVYQKSMNILRAGLGRV